MHTICTEQISNCCLNEIVENFCVLLDSFSNFSTLLLGVITIILGSRYISQKRNDAKFGFYINLHIYIKRFNYYITKNEYKGLTHYLCEKEQRKKYYSSAIPEDRANTLIPLFVDLCDEFLVFISNADNNVVPKYKWNLKTRKKEEWNKWYDSLSIIVDFAQVCKLLKEGLTPYVSDTQISEYKNELNAFTEALKYLDTKLEITLKK